MGKSLTEMGSRENGKREFANSFKFFHKGKEKNVVIVEGKIESNFFFFFGKSIGRTNNDFVCSKKKF